MWRSNNDDRIDVIEDIGKKEFYTNEAYSGLQDIAPPVCFTYIWTVFIELYNSCQDGLITFRDIESWQNVTGERLSLYEISLVRKMLSWGNSEIDAMKKDEER